MSSPREGYWFNLKTTFDRTPFSEAFRDEPRTKDEAVEKGWIEIGECGDDSGFQGNRYGDTESPKEIVLIYDVNGYIAGIQHVIPKDGLDPDDYDFDEPDFYQSGKYLKDDVYYFTSYFVDPDIICDKGRSQEEFETQGTGNKLIFQVGSDTSEKNLKEIPTKESEVVSKLKWTKQKFNYNMGTHYTSYSPDDVDEDCSTLFPVMLLYNKGELHGFVQSNIASLKTKRWEQLSAFGLEITHYNPPKCLLKAVESPGLSSMHVYFKDIIVLRE